MKSSLFFLFGIVSLFLFSCAPVYQPTNHNVSLFKKKGEAIINTSFSGESHESPERTKKRYSANVGAAYALTNHLAVSSNFNVFDYKNSIGITNILSGGLETSKGYQLDAAIGGFTSINDHLIFETYVGGGLSKLEGSVFTGSLEKLYIQPSIGYRMDAFEFAFSARGSFVRFTDNPLEFPETSKVTEAFLTVRFLKGRWKATMQFGAIYSDSIFLVHSPLTANIGFSYRIGK